MRCTLLRMLAPAVLLAWAAAAPAEEKLPSDPRVQTGTLPNGVSWMYRQHDNPPGKMHLLIHVDTGSLNETDAQRGLAHFLEHMAFNGTEHFGPGELIPYFESIGMEFGADLNAFTSFDQTAYMLFLPDTEVATVDKALTVLSDYAFRQLLLEEELDRERGVILAELRAGMSAQQRIRDKLFEQLFAGMRVGQRLPIGVEAVIRDAPRSEFERYYRTWYRPERITLLMVGDAPPDAYRPAIEKWFGSYRAELPAQAEERAGLRPFAAERALILTDPEYATGDVDIYDIRPARPPTTTVALARVDLVERLGSWIVDRRFSERIKKGLASYRQASVSVTNFLQDGMLVNASAVGEPQDWEKMLAEVIVELNRAREHGFTDRELELARADLLASAERAVRTEPTVNARALLFAMNRTVNAGEPVMSAQQELDLLSSLLPTITRAEVEQAFAANFQPGASAYVLTLPEKEDVRLPTPDEVLAAARAARARQTEPPPREEHQTELLAAEPTPGRLVESTYDEELGITSGWLANGARVHHRFMDYKKDTVLLSVTLAGGEIEETTENAGVTAVAALALQQPATGRLSSTEIQDILTGKNISVGGVGDDDAFSVNVSGSPRDLELGLRLAHALLTDGRIEPSALDNWRQAALQQYELYSRFPQYAAFDALLRTVMGDDPRKVMLMPPERIRAQTLERGQAWFERLRREAPLEVAVVGEITLEEALPLLEKYVGSLPPRPRGAAGLEPLRQVRRDAGPYERRVEVPTVTPQAMVICGFLGCDAQDTRDLRALNLAANILDSRLVKRVREELGLVYGIGAQNVPAEAYPGAGFFFSGAPCDPARSADVIREVEAIFQDFAEHGPTAEELENAKKQTLNKLDTQLKEPNYWYGRLRTFDLHKGRLEDLKNIPAAYEAFSAEEVRDVFRKYYAPQRRLRVTAHPTKPAESPASAESAAPAGRGPELVPRAR